MTDLLEHGGLYPQLDIVVDDNAINDVVATTDVCDPPECYLTLRLTSVRDRVARDIIKRLQLVDTKDMGANGLTKSGIDKTLLHTTSNDRQFEWAHIALTHTKVSVNVATIIRSTPVASL